MRGLPVYEVRWIVPGVCLLKGWNWDGGEYKVCIEVDRSKIPQKHIPGLIDELELGADVFCKKILGTSLEEAANVRYRSGSIEIYFNDRHTAQMFWENAGDYLQEYIQKREITPTVY